MKSYIKDEAKKTAIQQNQKFSQWNKSKNYRKTIQKLQETTESFFFAQVYINQKPNTLPKDGKSLVKMKINYISL